MFPLEAYRGTVERFLAILTSLEIRPGVVLQGSHVAAEPGKSQNPAVGGLRFR